MKITKISQQSKDKSRYNLFIDEKFWLGVDENVLVKFALFKEQEITQALMKAIEDFEYRTKYYQKAIHYLGRGMKTSSQVVEYLHQKMSDQVLDNPEVIVPDTQEVIAWIIDTLTHQGYLNDEAYSKAFVRNQMQLQHIGPIKISQQLKEKGIEDELIHRAMNEYPQDLLEENIHLTIEKFMKSHQKIARKVLKSKLGQYLFQRGFSSEHYQDIDLDNYLTFDEEREMEILDQDLEKIFNKFSRKYEGYALKQRIVQAGLRKGHNYEDISRWLSKKGDIHEI